MNFKRIRHVLCAVIIMVLLIQLVSIFDKLAATDLKYCKRIALEMGFLDLRCYKCTSITSENNFIDVYFSLKNENLFYGNTDFGVYDMSVVKDYLENYLRENPRNELCKMRISVYFQTHPADSMLMCNYDYMDDAYNATIYRKFLFYKNIEVQNFSVLQIFDSVCKIDVCSEKMDSAAFLKKWDNLSYISIYTQDLTQEKLQKDFEPLIGCDIYINGERSS